MARWVGVGTQQPRVGFDPATSRSQVWLSSTWLIVHIEMYLLKILFVCNGLCGNDVSINSLTALWLCEMSVVGTRLVGHHITGCLHRTPACVSHIHLGSFIPTLLSGREAPPPLTEGKSIMSALNIWSPGWPLTWETQKVKEFKIGRGRCVLACGHLPWVLFLTQNMQERSSLLGKVLHIEHSCHSMREYMSIAVRNNIHFVLCGYCCKGRYSVDIRLRCRLKPGNMIMTGEWLSCITV